MSQIKLLHSGGNGVSIVAPDSNPASDRTLKLPSDGDGTILTTNSATGKILQVKHTFKNDAFSDSSGGYAAITGLSVTITAASTSNKLLFVCNLTYSISAQTIFHARLYDGTSEITASRSTISSTANQNAWITDYNKSNVSAGDMITNTMASYLHTPADTNSHTYNIYARSAGGNSIYINRREVDTDFGGTSSFYVYEVAA